MKSLVLRPGDRVLHGLSTVTVTSESTSWKTAKRPSGNKTINQQHDLLYMKEQSVCVQDMIGSHQCAYLAETLSLIH